MSQPDDWDVVDESDETATFRLPDGCIVTVSSPGVPHKFLKAVSTAIIIRDVLHLQHLHGKLL